MTLTINQYNLYKSIAKAPTNILAKAMEQMLHKHYNKVITNNTYDYIFAEGNIPIAVIAHLDTVYIKPPRKIYYDTTEDIIWSPEGGIGDDRAGVFLIYQLLKEGYLPHVFLMNDEEFGGLGAQILTEEFPLPPFDIKYFIELDRHGNNDAVFYDCANEEFTQYILNFGFKEKQGLFSDISIICPAWKIAGVNLSIGYYNEHSLLETWSPKIAFETLTKVKNMLMDCKNSNYFIYKPNLKLENMLIVDEI